jgi:hypothetical protein
LIRAAFSGAVTAVEKCHMNKLDVVALTEDLPQKGLHKGQVGTIVEQLAPQVYEVEFSGLDGRTYATAAVPEERLIRLIHEPAPAP